MASPGIYTWGDCSDSNSKAACRAVRSGTPTPPHPCSNSAIDIPWLNYTNTCVPLPSLSAECAAPTIPRVLREPQQHHWKEDTVLPTTRLPLHVSSNTEQCEARQDRRISSPTRSRTPLAIGAAKSQDTDYWTCWASTEQRRPDRLMAKMHYQDCGRLEG